MLYNIPSIVHNILVELVLINCFHKKLYEIMNINKSMITAELTIIPIGTSKTSLSKYIAAAVAALDIDGIKYELTGMGTLLESNDLGKIFSAITAAHEAVF